MYIAFEEKGYQPYLSMVPNIYNVRNHKLMSYDYLEFKVTISCNDINVKPISLELNFQAQTSFSHNYNPDDSEVTEILLTLNNPDTTIYFTWSPHNLSLH